MAPLPSLRPPDQTADPYVLIACSCEMPLPDIGRPRSHREMSGPPPAAFNFQTANASPPLLFATQGASVSLFRFPEKGGMERREAPGACETPLGGPCDRPACAPYEGARPDVEGRRLPALHRSVRYRERPPAGVALTPFRPTEVVRHPASLEMTPSHEQGAMNISAVREAGISYFPAPLPASARWFIESRQAPVAQLDRALPSEGKGQRF